MAKISLFLVSVLSLIVIANTGAVKKRDHNDYSKHPHRIVCYLGSWAYYHKAEPFVIEDIDIDLCTHLNYGFAKINEYNYEIEVFDPNVDTDNQREYQRFVSLRKKNPNLTTMISLGGWNEGSEKYSDMAKTKQNRDRFVKSVVTFLQKYDFDGLDLDWEYPGNRGGAKSDKENYILLLTELREAFEPHGYLLTAALSPGKDKIDLAYDIPKVYELLDWGNIMTYDYHGGWEDYLGHNAPLYARPDEVNDPNFNTLNVNFTINYYLDNGFKKDKIVMGIPFYGRAWTLESPDKVHLHDPAKGMSPEGFITNETGVFEYIEMCQMERWDEWHNTYDPYYRAPYAYNKTLFVGFENVLSIACKVSFLKQMGLSGGMIWSLEGDDFKGRCGSGGKYPLLNKVYNMLNGKESNSFECKLADIPDSSTTPRQTPPSTTPTTQRQTDPPTTPTTQRQTPPTTRRQTTQPPVTTVKQTEKTTTESTREPFVTTRIGNQIVRCYAEGYQPHPTDKHKYIVCEYISEGARQGWWIHIMGCAPGTRWNQSTENCIADN